MNSEVHISNQFERDIREIYESTSIWFTVRRIQRLVEKYRLIKRCTNLNINAEQYWRDE